MDPQSLTISVTGEISHADILGYDKLFCKYFFVKGSDWTTTQGVEDGATQISFKSGGPVAKAVWNFPLDIVFSSTNPYGWPQLVICVYGNDLFGRNVIVGYGWAHVPMVPGRVSRDIRIFRPKSSSLLQGVISYISGRYPEFRDPRFVAQVESREIARCESKGTVRVRFDTILRNFDSANLVTAPAQPVQIGR